MILGYKVHSEVIRVSNDADASPSKVKLVVGEPSVTQISVSGVTVSIAGGLQAAGFEGRVERLRFRDFTIKALL